MEDGFMPISKEPYYLVHAAPKGTYVFATPLHPEEPVFDTRAWIADMQKKHLTLRPAHLKILEFLSQQYDARRNTFHEVDATDIAKRCRLNLREAHSHLDRLEEQNMVFKRSAGKTSRYKIMQLEDRIQSFSCVLDEEK